MENITITTQLANAIVQYLATKPYAEVDMIASQINPTVVTPALPWSN